MSLNKIGILVLAFLLLGSYVYFYEIGKKDNKDQPPEKEKILDINPEDVREIILKKEDQSITLRRVKDQWGIIKPANLDVANDKVYDLLALFDYGIVRVIDTNPSDLKQYGLDRPRYELWIKTKGDDTFQTLLIGGGAPGNISCYGKVKGQDKVVLLGILYRQDLDRALTDFSRALKGSQVPKMPKVR